MAKQRSVQEQNELVRAEIVRVAHWATDPASPVPWLPSVLGARGIDAQSGILARCHVVPEQEGDLYSCIWLTRDLHFFALQTVVDRSSGALVAVESFSEVTSDLRVSEHERGTGKTFARLAQEVLQGELAS